MACNTKPNRGWQERNTAENAWIPESEKLWGFREYNLSYPKFKRKEKYIYAKAIEGTKWIKKTVFLDYVLKKNQNALWSLNLNNMKFWQSHKQTKKLRDNFKDIIELYVTSEILFPDNTKMEKENNQILAVIISIFQMSDNRE